MEKTSALIGNISTSTQDFIKLQSKAIKLEMYERLTNAIAGGIGAALILLFGLFAFLFVNLGLGFWLGEILNSNKLGFSAVGVFYLVALGIYLFFRHKIAHNKLKNMVLHKISKDMDSYELMLKEQDIVHAQVLLAEQSLKDNFEELKNNFHVIKEDINNIKGHFVGHEEKNEHVGPKIPRLAVTSAVEFVMQHFLFKNAGLVKKTLLPIVANALITSGVFKESKKTSLVENLKLKFAKLL